MDFFTGPIPTILSGTFTILKSAYDCYEEVSARRQEIKLMLDRCRDLVARVVEYLAANPGERSQAMNKGLDALHKWVDICLADCMRSSNDAPGHANMSSTYLPPYGPGSSFGA